MKKQQALSKIEELKQFVEELDKQQNGLKLITQLFRKSYLRNMDVNLSR